MRSQSSVSGSPAADAARRAAAAAAARTARWVCFHIADFRRLWLIGLVVFAVRWLEMIVVGVFVYQRTGSAFRGRADDAAAHAADGDVRPGDRRGRRAAGAAHGADRRRGRPANIALPRRARLCWAAGGLASRGRELCQRRRLGRRQPGAAGHDRRGRRAERMGAAMSIDVGANNASRMLGPTVGGLVLAHLGIAGAFSISVALLRARAGRGAAGCSTATRSPPSGTGRADPDGRGVSAGAARPAAGRDPDRDRHLQRLRLAVHQHDPGDRPGQPAPWRQRYRYSRQHGRDRLLLRRDRDRACGPGRRTSPGSISARSDLSGAADRLCPRAASAARRRRPLVHRPGKFRVQRDAGDADLPRRAGRHAQPALWRPLAVHRRRAWSAFCISV